MRLPPRGAVSEGDGFEEFSNDISTILTPAGTINITENDTVDVTEYAEADVAVPQPSGKITITENGTDIDVTDYSLADVEVPQPSGKITISENGEDIDVAQYALADVDVVSGATLGSELNIESGVLTSGETWIEGKLELVIPEGVTTILDGVFADKCNAVTDLSFPSTLISIDNYTFNNCQALTTLTLPASLQSIGESCFSGCDSLTDIYYLGTQQEYEAITGINDAGFKGTETIHYNYTPAE